MNSVAGPAGDLQPALVTVVIPAYHAAGTLPVSLRALSLQTYPRACYEIIVVDDGSSDATAQVAATSGADHVVACPHRGPAAARNAGAAAATGDILLFTDADCEPTPDWIRLMLEPFGDASVAGVKGSYRTRQRETVARLAQSEFEERYDLQERQPAIDFVDTYAAAFRASVFRLAGGFDPAFTQANNEDVDLSYRLAEAGHRLVFQRPAVVYHRHVASWRRYARLKLRRGFWRMLVYRLHPGKVLRDSYTPQTLKLQVLLVYAISVCLASAGLASIFAPDTRLTPMLTTGALLGVATLVLSGWSFYKLVAKRERAVVGWAPLFIVVRSLAFAAGVAAGLVGMPFFRPTRSAVRPCEPVAQS